MQKRRFLISHRGQSALSGSSSRLGVGDLRSHIFNDGRRDGAIESEGRAALLLKGIEHLGRSLVIAPQRLTDCNDPPPTIGFGLGLNVGYSPIGFLDLPRLTERQKQMHTAPIVGATIAIDWQPFFFHLQNMPVLLEKSQPTKATRSLSMTSSSAFVDTLPDTDPISTDDDAV